MFNKLNYILAFPLHTCRAVPLMVATGCYGNVIPVSATAMSTTIYLRFSPPFPLALHSRGAVGRGPRRAL